MIRNVTYSDIDTVLKIAKSCAKHVIHNYILQRNDYYFNKNTFKNDVKRSESYALKVQIH